MIELRLKTKRSLFMRGHHGCGRARIKLCSEEFPISLIRKGIDSEISSLFNKLKNRTLGTSEDKQKIDFLADKYPHCAEAKLFQFYLYSLGDETKSSFFSHEQAYDVEILRELKNNSLKCGSKYGKFRLTYYVSNQSEALELAYKIFYNFLKRFYEKVMEQSFKDQAITGDILFRLKIISERDALFKSIYKNKSDKDFTFEALVEGSKKLMQNHFSTENEVLVREHLKTGSIYLESLKHSKKSNFFEDFPSILSLIQKFLIKVSLFFTFEQKDTKDAKKADDEPNSLNDQLARVMTVLKERSQMRDELSEIISLKSRLEQLFDSQSECDLFLETRLHQYIAPFLAHIIEHEGKLDNDSQERFEKTFKKLNKLLSLKIKELVKQKNEIRNIEFDVIDKEIDKALKEFK